MVISAFSISIMVAVIRHLSADLHTFQLLFFRNIFGMIFFLPWVIWTLRNAGTDGLKTSQSKLYMARSCFGFVAMFLWFYALAIIPLATATSLSFLAPLISVILAMIFLGEPSGLRRWAALIVGFIGTVIILRPGTEAFHSGSLIAVASSFFWAIAAVIVKKLSSKDSPMLMATYSTSIMTCLSLVPALIFWRDVPDYAWKWLFVLGITGSMAQYAFNKSFSLADVSFAQAFDFSRLIFAALVGWVFFAETIDMPTVIGALIIFSSSIYALYREAVAMRKLR